MKYNIGQVLRVKEELKVVGALGDQKTIRVGTKLYVGADNFTHTLSGILIPNKDDEIEGYSVKGIADFIYEMISNRIPIDDMLEDYDIEIEVFKEEIEDALEELGMWDNSGNRS